MTIKIRYSNAKLNITFVNPDNISLRVWEFDNSWGWNTLKWMITYKSDERKNIIKITKLQKKGWTKNGPTFFEISPNSGYSISNDFSDGDWEFPQEINAIKTMPVILKCILDIPDSPEAIIYDVFTGKLESNEIILNPPHKWLPEKFSDEIYSK
jgi:hypothetical protein